MIALWIQDHWQKRGVFAALMLPLAWLYCFVMKLRRLAYANGWFKSYPVGCPVIVIGNLSVGGTGKTPLVIWLAEKLTASGYRPGIVSRGYGGSASDLPLMVSPDTPASVVGDEPALISHHTGCPVAISPDRVAASTLLLSDTDCNIIIADDGLQHLRMQRDIEIAVIASDRIAGNGWCLPAGPLREAPGTLRNVDIIISRTDHSQLTDWNLTLEPIACLRVDRSSDDMHKLEEFSGKTVHAVAGIGNPDGFFSTLRSTGLDVIEHPFPDHHPYTPADLDFGDGNPVIMTEKDAIKCVEFADPHWWALTVSAAVDEGILETIENKLQETVRSG